VTASVNVELTEAAPVCRPPSLKFNRGGRFVGRRSLAALGTLEAGKKCARLHSKYADATQKKSYTSDGRNHT